MYFDITYIHKVKPKNAQNEKCKKNYMDFLNIEYVIMIYYKRKKFNQYLQEQENEI